MRRWLSVLSEYRPVVAFDLHYATGAEVYHRLYRQRHSRNHAHSPAGNAVIGNRGVLVYRFADTVSDQFPDYSVAAGLGILLAKRAVIAQSRSVLQRLDTLEEALFATTHQSRFFVRHPADGDGARRVGVETSYPDAAVYFQKFLL